MAPIPASLLKLAREGEVVALQALATRLTDENYTVLVLDACLTNLQLEKVPLAIDSAAAIAEARRGWTALDCLFLCIRHYDRVPTRKHATIERIYNTLDGIIAWRAFVLDAVIHCPPNRPTLDNVVYATSLTLQALLCLDERTTTAVFTSVPAFTLLFKLWTVNDNGKFPVVRDSTTGSSPLISLVRRYLESAEGSNHLFDELASSPPSLKAFCNVLARRASLLAETPLPKGEFESEAFYQIHRIFQYLIENQVVHQELRALGYITVWSSTIISCSSWLSPDGVLNLIHDLFHLAYAEGGNAVSGIAEAISAGLLRPFFKAFAEASDTAEVGGHAEHVLRIVYNAAYYPRCRRALTRMVLDIPRETLAQCKRRAPKRAYPAYQFYGMFWKTLQLDLGRDRSEDLAICDNDAHWDREVPPSVDGVKTCSSCRSVVYCGVACQTEDWAMRHMHECTQMRYSSFVRSGKAIRYTHRTRAFQLSCLRKHMEDLVTRIDNELAPRKESGEGSHGMVVVVRVPGSMGRPTAFDFVIYAPAVYLEARFKPDCPAAEARANTLLAEYALNQADRDGARTAQLMELRLLWGERQLGVLAELKPTDESRDKWEVTRNVILFDKECASNCE